MDSSQLRQRIIDLYTSIQSDGSMLGIKDIAPLVGIHHSTVAYHLKQANTPRRPKGQSKLFPHHHTEIIRQYTTPLPDGTWKGTTLIARDFGVADTAIQKILHDAGVAIRDAKEAHAHGKRCGPIKHTEQLGKPPRCACGCKQQTHWVRSKYRWAKYVRGHYRQNSAYKDETWLREQYLELRRNAPEIATECKVNVTTIIRYMERYGIERRTTKESLKGVQAGARNPAWKGGVTPERQRLYKTEEWKEMIKAVFARDSYQCQRCKGGIGGKGKRMGAAHHIKSFADHPDLRTEMTNLVTLCRPCHGWVHSNANIAGEFLG